MQYSETFDEFTKRCEELEKALTKNNIKFEPSDMKGKYLCNGYSAIGIKEIDADVWRDNSIRIIRATNAPAV